MNLKQKEIRNMRHQLEDYARGKSTFNYFIKQLMQIEEFYKDE